MVDLKDFGDYETAWCPGCGNFSILKAVKLALVKLGISPREVLFVSGIGQAAKLPHYLNANVFNGLHGRSLAVSTGAKLANHRLTVIAESGDGCNYGEGGNHFLAAIRRNIDITLLVHDNRVYGLTKGQASPTSPSGFVTKAQPGGNPSIPFNPISVATVMKAGFVARGFAGDTEYLVSLICQAITHRGFSLVDILQPCVSFNKINTFAWYQERCYRLDDSYDPTNQQAALELALMGEERIPTGVIYKNNRPSFEENITLPLGEEPLVARPMDLKKFQGVMSEYNY